MASNIDLGAFSPVLVAAKHSVISAGTSRTQSQSLTVPTLVRTLAIGIAIAVVVFAATGGHFFFLPLLFVPLGLFSMGHRKQRRNSKPEEYPRFR